VSSRSGLFVNAGLGNVRGVDWVSRITVSERNDDIPSILPSGGRAVSTPKLFLSRYVKNCA